MDKIHQATMRDKLSQLHTLLETADDYKSQVKEAQLKVAAQKKDNSPEHQKELEAELEQFKTNTRIHLNQLYGDVVHKLEEVKETIEDGKVALDMSSPTWQNALNTLNAAGERPSGELLRTIVASVGTDQEMLKGLKEVFDSRGLKYDGELSKKISNAGMNEDYLRDFALASISQSVSLNSFAHAIDRQLKPLGFEFPPVTGSVLVESARKAAGLPDKKIEDDEPETPIEVSSEEGPTIKALRESARLSNESETPEGGNDGE